MNPRLLLPIALLTALPLGLAACGSSLPDGVAIQVAGQDIPAKEISTAVESQLSTQGSEPPAPDSEEYQTVARMVAEQAVYQRLVLAAAKECGAPCLATPEKIAQRRTQIIKENFKGKKSEFQGFLTQQGLSEADVTRIIRFEIEEKRIRARETKGMSYSLKEALAYCTKNPAQFKQPEQRTARHILVADKATADRLASEVTVDTFAQAAKENSIDPGSKNKGGDLGAISKGQMVPQFEKAAFALGDGEISAPVKTQFGWHLITVNVTPARQVPCAEAAPGVRTQQLAQQREAKMATWKQEQLKKFEPQIIYADETLKPQPQPTAPLPVPAPAPAK